MSLFTAQTIRLEDVDLEVQQLMNPDAAREEISRVPLPRPSPKNFGRRALEALTGEDRQHAIVLDPLPALTLRPPALR